MQLEATPSLGFSEAINTAISKITQFNGRARRSEYWWTMALVFVINFFLTPFIGLFANIATIPLEFRRLHDTGKSGWWWGIGVLLQIALIVSVCFDIALEFIYNKYDYEAEGELMWAFIAKYTLLIIAIIVFKIILFFFTCLDSDPYENKYGESPKYVIKERTEQTTDTDGRNEENNIC